MENPDRISPEKAERERIGRSKANAEYQKVISTLMTYSISAVALIVIFFKDIFGEKLTKGMNVFSLFESQSFIGLMLCTSIVLLFASLYFGIQYIHYSGYFIRQIHRKFDPVEWCDRSANGIKTKYKLDFFFYAVWVCTLSGAIITIIAAMFYRKAT